MKKYIYMKTDGSEEDLPVAVADTVKELAEMVGRKPNSISSMLSKGVGKYKRVELLQDD